MSKKRRTAIRRIEPIEMVFEDGTTKEAVFTVESLILMQEEFGDLATLSETEKHKPYDLAAKLLYCGMKILDSTVTLEEAKSIIIGGGLPLMEDIFESVIETFDGMDIDSEELKKKVQNQLRKMGVA